MISITSKLNRPRLWFLRRFNFMLMGFYARWYVQLVICFMRKVSSSLFHMAMDSKMWYSAMSNICFIMMGLRLGCLDKKKLN